MGKKIFFFASSKGIGLTSHYAEQVIDMYKYALMCGDSFFCVSSTNEQNSGLWSLVHKNLPESCIVSYTEDNLSEATDKINRIIGSQIEPAIVHVQGLAQIVALRGLVSRHKAKLILTIHSFVVKPLITKIIKGALSYLIVSLYVDKIIFLSPFAMRRYPFFRFLEKQGKIVHIPFNLPMKSQSEEPYVLEKGKWNVVYLANFLKNKGHERYKDAIFTFAKKYPNSRFYFFGEGPRREVFTKEVFRAGLNEQIRCPGRVEYKFIGSILSQANIVLSLSEQETAGHNAVEAMLNGVPVVGTRVGCAEYLLQDYITGFAVHNNKTLFYALERVYASPVLEKHMGESAQKSATVLYEYSDMIQAYFCLYQNL